MIRVRRPGRASPRLAAAVQLLAVLFAAAPAPLRAQEALSPLPAPQTRSLYRASWFEYLSAFSDNDMPTASKALEQMIKAARRVGVHRLSDFSRTAVYLGRRAEKQGSPERAERAFDAAIQLDDANPDAAIAIVAFRARHGRVMDALKGVPAAAAALFATHESRVAMLSLLGLLIVVAWGATVLAAILVLALAHLPRAVHDIRESARWHFGRSAALPLALLILALPLFVGLGPVWLILYWGALLYPYARGRERKVLAFGLVGLAIVPPLMAWLTQINIQERSPLMVAAVDLAERREDASAEDGLRQASAVFPEDADVWFLLGVFAERSGDFEKARNAYNKATDADPSDYRPILNRGNVHFTEGDFGEAVRDYIEASKREPRSADVFYNLSLARGEAYDFAGQSDAIATAREISASQVAGWTNNPTVSRVVPAGYPIARAREHIERWNSQPKSRRLPGHGTAARPLHAMIPWSLPPIGILLLGALLTSRRARRGLAAECDHCGRVICNRCRRYNDPAGYCAMCSQIYLRKESVDIEVQVAETRAAQRRAKWRLRAGRIASLLLPGSRAIFEERPVAGAITLFLFFFGLAAAILDESLFDPMTLPPTGGVRATVMAGAALAFVVWLRAQLAARRVVHGGS